MDLYFQKLSDWFHLFDKRLGNYFIRHEMLPFREIDVVELNETQQWKLVDVITIEHVVTKELFTFQMDILNVPYHTVNGYKIKGVYRQTVDLYEMSKGWHFEDKGSENKLEPYIGRVLKFYPDTSLSALQNFYSIEIKHGMVAIVKKNNFVPISIFLRALTGNSFHSILAKIGVSNKYIVAAFQVPEYSRSKCVDICSGLFSYADKNSLSNNSVDKKKRESAILTDVLSFMNKFTLSGAMIGNGSDRLVSMVRFRGIENCVLRKKIEFEDAVILEGTKLTPELLLELDYSEVDEIVCSAQDSEKTFIFRKYEVYNFRGLHKGGMDTIEDFQTAEAEEKLTYHLSTGEILTRKMPPFCNTVDIIYNMVNLYLNYLNGYHANSNVYDMTNQSVIGMERDILNAVSDRVTFINSKVEELDLDEEERCFSVVLLVLKLTSFDLNVLIDKYASVTGKAVHLSAVENSLSIIAQTTTIAKDISHAQRDMVLVQDTQIGRLDPFDVPDNKNIGITHNATFLSQINSDAQITVPFVKVSNGNIVSDVVYLSALEEKDQYIGEWDETFSKPLTKARYNGIFVMVPPEKLNYIEASCFQHLSCAHALSPFAEAMAGKRAQMSSANAKQAIAIVGAERPIVNTGAESLICSINSSIAPYITANSILRGYALARKIEFDLIEGEELTYEGFSDDGTDRIHKFSFYYNGMICHESKKLPYFQRTLQGTIYGFRLNSALGLKFKDEDIVLHSLTYDANKYDHDDDRKEGHLSFDSSRYDTGLALGINLHIGYMTYGSSTIEDAITLNDRLVTDDGLSSVSVYQEEYEIKPMDFKKESFGFLDEGDIPEGFGYSGLPNVGTYLPPGAIVIYKYIRRFHSDGMPDEESAGYTANIELPPTIGGEVVSVSNKRGTSVVVTLVSLSKIEAGDKMAGRYGNKGVVAKIVPNYLMPFDTRTGQPLDIILNPLGIPSRINVSQVLEVTLAACNKKQGTITVTTPFQHNQLEKIKLKAQQCGIMPIHLMNPLNGMFTNYAVHVGEIYMYKLMHRVSGKMKSIGITNEVDSIFKQPVGTGRSKEKGQAFGEMESWCLQSSKSFYLLEELQTILADDIEMRTLAQEQIDEHPGPVDLEDCLPKNANSQHLVTFFKSAGIKIVQDSYDPSILSYEPMQDCDIKLLNPEHPINVKDPVNSLRSPSIFSTKYDSEEDKWSWIPLFGEIVNPFWLERGSVLKLIIVKRLQNGKLIATVLRPIDVEKIFYETSFLYKAEKDGQTDWILCDKTEKAITGMLAIVTLFKEYTFSISKQYYEQLECNSENYKSQIAQILAAINDVERMGGLSIYIISCFPVMPIRYRPLPVVASAQQDFDYFYTAIARCAASYAITHSNKDIMKAYEYIGAFLGVIGEKRKDALLSGKRKYTDLKTYFTVKQSSGRIRGMMAKKRVHRSGRSVLIPFSDISYSPLYIGVPYLMVIDLYKAELVSLLQKVWTKPFERLQLKKRKNDVAFSILKNAVVGNEIAVRKLTLSTAPNQSQAVKKMIKEFCEQQIIIFGRQPSLFKFNIRAFYVVLVEGKALQLHPLVCKGFNADYDGDTGYLIAPLTKRACEEAWNTLSVVACIVNPGDGEIILEPSQDLLLGCYYATSFEKNVLLPEKISPIYYGNIRLLENDLDLGVIQPYTWAIVTVNGKDYISTAGRIVFNRLISGGFTDEAYLDKFNLGISSHFFNLKYDYVVSGRVSDEKLYVSIKAIFKQLYEEYESTIQGREKLIGYYQAISEFGFKWSERSGISFHLEDLQESPMIKTFLKAAENVSVEIDRKYSMGLITAKDRRSAIMSIYGEIRTKEFQRKFMQGFERTNNIFMMFDSKARGSEDQIMQTCGLLGVLQKTKLNSLDTPITGNYATGLSSFDMFQTSYSARLGLLSTIRETSKPGELTRTLVYSFSGLYISEDSCQTKPPSITIRYERSSDFIFLNNKQISFSDIEGALVEDEFALAYIRPFSPSGFITQESFEELKNSGLPWIQTNKGRVDFDVKFPTFLSKLLLYRTASSSQYNSLIKNKYFSAETLLTIEEERARTVDAMILCNCISEDGICADSYGLCYDCLEPGKIGDFPGIESAQAIGQPAAQLTISLFHTGGKAGEAVDDGVAIMSSAIQSGKISVGTLCLCSPVNGFVEITDDKLSIRGVDQTAFEQPISEISGRLLVRNGSFVGVGQPISEGNIHPLESFVFHTVVTADDESYSKVSIGSSSAVVNPSIELLTKIRYELAKFYYDTYYENSIQLFGRHFEVASFMQTSHGICLRSSNPDFIKGRFYTVGSLVKAEGIDFAITIQKAFDTISRNSGVIAAACYQNAYEVIGNSMLKGDSFRERGPLSAILTGSSISSKGLYMTELETELDYKKLSRINNTIPFDHSRDVEIPIVFETFVDETTENGEVVEHMTSSVNDSDLIALMAELEQSISEVESNQAKNIETSKLNKF